MRYFLQIRTHRRLNVFFPLQIENKFLGTSLQNNSLLVAEKDTKNDKKNNYKKSSKPPHLFSVGESGVPKPVKLRKYFSIFRPITTHKEIFSKSY